jgi:UDP-N-acetylmuramate dehydrogenase
LGGGSNVLCADVIDGLVVQPAMKGVEIVSESSDSVVVKVAAGEVWHGLVEWTLAKGMYGLENLALIPGCVGAAPIQNIGAYGVEVCDFLVELEALSLDSKDIQVFSKADCQFGYRDSIFKGELKNKTVITEVCFRLQKSNYNLQTSYGAIEQQLAEQNHHLLTPKDVANAVIAIRTRKLPDPKKLGNAGSFFKNPIVEDKTFWKLKESHPEIPHFKLANHSYKIPAAWLIEQVGLKGTREGDVGTHENHALVLVNYGNASGQEITDFSKKIQTEVQKHFGITLTKKIKKNN